MAQLSDVLGSIPGLGGYLAKQQFDQQQGTAELANANQFMRLQTGFQDQAAAADTRQREGKFRQGLAALGPNASHEQIINLAAQSGLVGAKDLTSIFQGEANKKIQIEANTINRRATQEAAMARLVQQANQFRQTHALRVAEADRRGASDDEKMALRREAQEFDQQIKLEGARIAGAAANYNYGTTINPLPQATTKSAGAPNGMPQGRLMTADGQQITDPAEIAAFDAVNSQSQQGMGMSMRQGDNGAFAPVPMAAGQSMTAPTGAMPRPMPQVPPQGMSAPMPQGMPQGAPQGAPQPMPPVQTAPMPLTISQGGTAPDVASAVVPAPGQGVPGVRAAAAAATQPAIPTMPPEIAAMPKREQAKWLLQQTKPSIAGAGTFTPEALNFTAKQYLSGDRQAVQGFARNATARIALQNEIVDEAARQGLTPEQTAAKMADFAGIVAGSRTVGQRGANIALAATEAKEMIGLVKETSDAFERTNFVPWNYALKAYESNTGTPEIARFGASLNALVNVYARAINPTGVPTVSDKQHARDVINSIQSPAQVDAVLDIIGRELDIAIKAPKTVREATRSAITGEGGTPAATQYPTATAPNGRKVIYKDGKWQTP